MGKYSKYKQLKTLKKLSSGADPRKQRKAILKVFKKHQDTLAHTSTSNTRKDSTHSSTSDIKKGKDRREVKKNASSTDTSLMNTEKMETKAAQKSRHRRSRGRSTSVDRSQRKVDRQERAEFRKKTRALNDATDRAKMERSALKDVNQSNNAAIITRSRLTQKIGIFNKGKRSEAIHRESIHISKETHAKAEEDMRKILDLSDAELSRPVRLQDLEIDCRGYSPTEHTLHPEIAHSPGPSIDPLYTPVVLQVKTSTPASTVTSVIMEVDPVTPVTPPRATITSSTLPEKPAFSKISSNLLSSLHPEKIFIGRKYFSEVQQELCQLMKKQRSVLIQTETRITPDSAKATTERQTPVGRGDVSGNVIGSQLFAKRSTPQESQGNVLVDKVKEEAPMEVDNMQPARQKVYYVNHRPQGDRFQLTNQQETLQVPVDPLQPPSVAASPVFFPSWHTYADLHPQAPHPQLLMEQGYRNNMDIIDYLDYQPPTGNPVFNYQQGNNRLVVRPCGSLVHHGFRSECKGQGVTSGGPDSPTWPPARHMLPWKPVEDTPSPRLYPMKLY